MSSVFGMTIPVLLKNSLDRSRPLYPVTELGLAVPFGVEYSYSLGFLGS